MTQTELSNFIFSIANLIRGPYRPPQYRLVMLPLTVLAAFKDLRAQGHTIELANKMVAHKFKLPFINTSKYTFKKLVDDADGLSRNLVLYIKGFSPEVRRILEKFEFEKEIVKLEKADRLFEVVQKFAATDLHPSRAPNTLMGHVFEDLIRRFNVSGTAGSRTMPWARTCASAATGWRPSPLRISPSCCMASIT